MAVLITCADCIRRLYPDDPRVKSGRYHLSGCQYCNKPQYFRNTEQQEHTQIIEHRHSDMSQKDYARLQNLEGQVKYLQGKLTEKQERKPRPPGYKGIK